MNSRKPTFTGLPSKEQILDFIKSAEGEAGKREIGKHFRLKGQEKIALKALLKDMAEEGLIDGRKSAYHRMGGVPKVTVLRIVEIDEGEPVAVPESWNPDEGSAPPRLRVIEKKKQAALRKGDRILARTEEAGRGWVAHPMKKLPDAEGAMLGVVEIDASGQAWLAPVDKKVRNSVKISDRGEADKGQLVLAEPTGRGRNASVKVIEVLGDPLAPRSYSLIAIHKFGIPHTFPQEVLDEAGLAAKLPLSEDRREDLRHLPIVAIDPADARDHDDAIWAESDGEGGFRAVVAIADVSFYVRPGSKLDREARKRGNSVYFPDRVVPMLPEVLSADVCSLKEGADRAAMACHLTIDKTGIVTDWRFTRALVRIDRVIAYEDAQAEVDAGNASGPVEALWACWKLLNAAREARDPLDLDLPERRVQLDEKGRITEIAVRERLDAHRVVEDFMIAANVAAAKALESKAQPIVYRIHEPPTREKLIAMREYFDSIGKNLALGQVITPGLFNRMMKDIADPAEKALVMEAVLRTQTQAYYGPNNAGHFGLALGSYAHFTSPIRRYSDLLVHRALVDGYGLEQPAPKGQIPDHSGLSDRDREALEKITDAISQTERRAMEAERDTIDRYVAAWLSARVGEVFKTRITGVQKFGFFATIADLGGDGLVPISTLGREYFHYDEAARALVGETTGTRYSVGDLLELRLGETNPLTGALKFELPEGGGTQRVEPRGKRPEKRPFRDAKGKQNAAKQNAGKRDVGKRGRPANIRHQGRGKKK
ncbi:ribonuclease R [Erythrobacter arachoides]|uniref:Ribonuclease R n=1 Tax=Aurantiacibacter arachoides TaxID=1850444 RepID=A0A844ZZ71_9SPHN|nr:ribonuclease R [Aurantiacibacter arachoides]MXO93195.1 ribonuclease R [Aurantiacibacter arachoides]GGD51281.1 ribonuclease R [Aurantiacibacter arachoides]